MTNAVVHEQVEERRVRWIRQDRDPVEWQIIPKLFSVEAISSYGSFVFGYKKGEQHALAGERCTDRYPG